MDGIFTSTRKRRKQCKSFSPVMGTFSDFEAEQVKEGARRLTTAATNNTFCALMLIVMVVQNAMGYASPWCTLVMIFLIVWFHFLHKIVHGPKCNEMMLVFTAVQWMGFTFSLTLVTLLALSMPTELMQHRSFLIALGALVSNFTSYGYIPARSRKTVYSLIYGVHWVWFHYATDFLRIPAIVIGGFSLFYQHNLLNDIESDARDSFELARNVQDDYEYMTNLKDTLSGMLSSFFDASCTVDRHSGIVSWTPQLQALLGMDELPAPSQSVYSIVSESDVKRLQNCLQLAMSKSLRTAVTIQVTLSCRTLPGSEREEKDVKLFCIKLPHHAKDSGRMKETQIFIGFQDLETPGLREASKTTTCHHATREIPSALRAHDELEANVGDSNSVTGWLTQDFWDAPMKEEDDDASLELSVTEISGVSGSRRCRSKASTKSLAGSAYVVPRTTVLDASTQTTIEGGSRRPPVLPGLSSSLHRPSKSTSKKKKVMLNTSFRVLEQYEETPQSVVKRMLVESLLQINPCGLGCCTFHVCVASLARVIRQLSSEQCKPTFELHSDWQCSNCKSLNYSYEVEEDDDVTCLVCSAQNNGLEDQSSHLSSSPAGE